LSGNPVAMAAGVQTLKKALRPGFYEKLEANAAHIGKILKDLPGVRLNRIGSMFTLFFINEEVADSATAGKCDKKRFAAWHAAMLNKKLYMPPSQFEACFVSSAHTKKDIAAFAAACADWIMNERAHRRR
jgi:glutamate-1-semialdehyde 2,1-aminomutase